MADNSAAWAAPNFAWVGVEIARHGELLDWYLTATGSATLILYNVIKIVQLLRYKQGESSKRKKKRKD